jgi:hypothetical protein
MRSPVLSRSRTPVIVTGNFSNHRCHKQSHCYAIQAKENWRLLVRGGVWNKESLDGNELASRRRSQRRLDQ